MELRQALAQVSEIREQLARTEVFRGYRSLTVGFSGLMGLAAASVQAAWLPQPTERLGTYLTLWIGAAAVNVVVVGAEMWSRARMARTELARQTTLFAVEQFMPALVAGGLLTVVIAQARASRPGCYPGYGRCCLVSGFSLRAGYCRGLCSSWASGISSVEFSRWRGDRQSWRCRRGSWELLLEPDSF